MSSALVTRILDGPRNVVFHVFIQGDGGGDLTDYVIIDPAELDPAMQSRPGLTLNRLQYDLIGFDGLLEFDELLSDRSVWTMTGDQTADIDFSPYGGIKDRSAALDGSGKLMLTTQGLSTGDSGTLIVWVRKT
jgi:hypothetical protein